MKTKISLALLSITVPLVSAQAATIAKWTFETSVPVLNNSTDISGIAAEEGSGVASGHHASADTDWSNPVGNGSGESLSVNTWTVGDYFQFQSSTIGFSGISVSFDHVSSSTGPSDFDFSYSTDGSVFTQFGLAYKVLVNTAPNNWSSGTPIASTSYTFDLSGVTELDGAALVYFRVTDLSTTSANGGTVAVTGTSRIDNFTIATVPEPATVGLLLAGAGALALRRRVR